MRQTTKESETLMLKLAKCLRVSWSGSGGWEQIGEDLDARAKN